ncbi:MAG: hypothetical protein K0Q90_549 [Paenibacillaceae bacterium]|nr:hypothetical protein [Paenibacillaceae bacterium]
MLLAGSLAAADAGHSLTMVVRTARQAEAISLQGITVRDRDGNHPHTAAAVCLDFAAYSAGQQAVGGGADWILLALKQKDISLPVIEAIRGRAGRDTRICCFQNGMGHLEKLRSVVGGDRLYAAVTTEGAMRLSDTEVWHTGMGGTRIGIAENGISSSGQHLAMLAEVLANAGFQTAVSENIQADIWDKLIINTVVNPLTALLDIQNGQLLDHPMCLELMQHLFEEADSAAAAAGFGRPDGLRWQRLVEVCRATAGNKSSMLQDLAAGRLTELEWLTGSLLREGKSRGLMLPYHETVYRLVKAKEALKTRTEEGIELSKNN